VAVSFRKSIGIPPAGRNDKIFPEHTLTTDKPEEKKLTQKLQDAGRPDTRKKPIKSPKSVYFQCRHGYVSVIDLRPIFTSNYWMTISGVSGCPD
jgi:hypothetical protein